MKLKHNRRKIKPKSWQAFKKHINVNKKKMVRNYNFVPKKRKEKKNTLINWNINFLLQLPDNI
jgi:hypothetical protein